MGVCCGYPVNITGVFLLLESYGGVEGSVPHDHHIPVVPELVRDTFPQQERLARGEDLLLAPRRLFSRV